MVAGHRLAHDSCDRPLMLTNPMDASSRWTASAQEQHKWGMESTRQTIRDARVLGRAEETPLPLKQQTHYGLARPRHRR